MKWIPWRNSGSARFTCVELMLALLQLIATVSNPAEKCRQLLGDEVSSKSRTERFIFLNCFDMKYGTLACVAKECVKMYFYYIRALHVHKARKEATEVSLKENLSKGKTPEEAMKSASVDGNAAAMRASRQVKHVIGPIISAGWDFFEAVYVGGTLAEGATRGVGTLLGAYIGGYVGDGRLGGCLGFLVGSQMGSWIGGRLGLMTYDIAKGVHYLLHLHDKETSSYLAIVVDPSL